MVLGPAAQPLFRQTLLGQSVSRACDAAFGTRRIHDMNGRLAVRVVFAIGVAACVLTANAQATTIARVTLPQMEHRATVVFVGQATSARRVPLAGPLPATRYGFEVERVLRGGPTRSIHLTLQDLPAMPVPLGSAAATSSLPRRSTLRRASGVWASSDITRRRTECSAT